MAYHQFGIDGVVEKFALRSDERTNLFVRVAELEPSAGLQAVLEENVPLGIAIATEKARSETMIAPQLIEARRLLNHEVSLFSGYEFNVDAEAGLTGFCDYIFSASPEQYSLRAPVLMIVEAKQENIPGGFGPITEKAARLWLTAILISTVCGGNSG